MSAFALGLANGAAARRGFAAASRRSASPLFRTIQARPKDQRSCADRLLMRQTACAWRFLPAMIGGGTWEGAHARHEAAGVRQPVRRCGGRVAARGAQAQQLDRMRRIGVLIPLAAHDPESQARSAAFLRGLSESGWTVGRNVQIDFRWAAGDADNIRKYAAELVALAPDVILGAGNPIVTALLQATRTLPIVFAGVADPVGAGFVASLARPSGNATGFTPFEFSIGGKWLELLKEIAPSVTRVAVVTRCRPSLRWRTVGCNSGGGTIARCGIAPSRYARR